MSGLTFPQFSLSRFLLRAESIGSIITSDSFLSRFLRYEDFHFSLWKAIRITQIAKLVVIELLLGTFGTSRSWCFFVFISQYSLSHWQRQLRWGGQENASNRFFQWNWLINEQRVFWQPTYSRGSMGHGLCYWLVPVNKMFLPLNFVAEFLFCSLVVCEYKGYFILRFAQFTIVLVVPL